MQRRICSEEYTLLFLEHFPFIIKQPINEAVDQTALKFPKETVLCRAAWLGSFITAAQASSESPGLIMFILKVLQGHQSEFENRLHSAEFSKEEVENFKDYSCGLFTNLGNFRYLICSSI